MWRFEHTETTSASAAELWRHYSDPASWPSWDHETVEVTVDGPFDSGTTGTIKPAAGPRAKFVFTEVSPLVGFTNRSSLPLAKLTFGHLIEPSGTCVRFTHSVTITGPLAPLFGRVIGRRIATELPKAMRALVELAEAAE